MSKCIAYVAAAVVFFGLGALISGACVWFLAPREIEPTIKTVAETRYAECVFSADVAGYVHLEQSNSNKAPLNIMVNITGLTPGMHGFHIHEFGVPVGGPCTDCGGHFNPMGRNHGGPDDEQRHVGDLGNINANTTEMEDHVASLWGDHSVVGRSIVIHNGQDDLGTGNDTESTKTGNAGARVACCTIFLVKE